MEPGESTTTPLRDLAPMVFHHKGKMIAFFLGVTFVLATRALPAGRAFSAALLASVTCGLQGGRKPQEKTSDGG